MAMGRRTSYRPNSVGYAFYLAMVLHPRVMKKAQEELDSVVGMQADCQRSLIGRRYRTWML
jgi:hypothetical protein